MIASAQRSYITPQEYVEMEAASAVKHEYYDGRLFAMAGATPTHCLVNSNILVSVGSRLRGRSCRGTGSDQRVKTEATDFMAYPDTLIVCAPERYDENDANSLLNPRVIIEVLSPPTELHDLTTKFDQYKQIESLTDYILVSQERVRVEHFERAEDELWILRSYNQREQTVRLPELDLELPLEEIYDRLDLPTGLILLEDEER